jgi:hypothetical protein
VAKERFSFAASLPYGLVTSALGPVCFCSWKVLDLFVLNYWGEVEEFGPSGTEGIVGGPFSFPPSRHLPQSLSFFQNKLRASLRCPRNSFIAAQLRNTDNTKDFFALPAQG